MARTRPTRIGLPYWVTSSLTSTSPSPWTTPLQDLPTSPLLSVVFSPRTGSGTKDNDDSVLRITSCVNKRVRSSVSRTPKRIRSGGLHLVVLDKRLVDSPGGQGSDDYRRPRPTLFHITSSTVCGLWSSTLAFVGDQRE